MRTMIRLVVVFYLIAGISGCADRKNCPGCMLADPLTVSCPYAGSQIASTLNPNPKVLVLSGGASHGAWGAGVITGWPDTGVAEPRPAKFDIVTGISTGALQAPYAFLGKNYDPQLEKFYTTSTTANIYSMKPDFLLSNALQDRAPLRQILEENVTRDAVVDVAKTSRLENRELYVGTINLDTSQFCSWNLSTIARKAEAELNDSPAQTCWVDLFRDAMFASSGAPVIAPPVEIDANACTGAPPQKMLYADGGVRLRVFVSEVVEMLPSTSNPSIYVIMNGQMNTRPTCVNNQLLPITLRTYEIMDHVALFGSLYQLMHQHTNWNLRLSRIPDTQCVSLPASEFDPVRMKAMFNGGSTWVKQASPWETAVPADAVANWPPGVAKPLQECAQVSTLPQTLLAPCPM